MASSACMSGRVLGLGTSAVLGEEELFQGRLPAQQLLDARSCQYPQQWLDRSSHLAPDNVALHFNRSHPGTRERSGTGPSNVASTVSAERWRISASVPISTSRPSRKIPTRSHNASTSLRMCEDRKTVWPRSRASWTQWRKACSMSGSSPLVGSSRTRSSGGHQRGEQDQLLTIPFGVGADLLRGIQIEASDQLVPVGDVHSALHSAEQVEGLGTGERCHRLASPAT